MHGMHGRRPRGGRDNIRSTESGLCPLSSVPQHSIENIAETEHRTLVLIAMSMDLEETVRSISRTPVLLASKYSKYRPDTNRRSECLVDSNQPIKSRD